MSLGQLTGQKENWKLMKTMRRTELDSKTQKKEEINRKV